MKARTSPRAASRCSCTWGRDSVTVSRSLSNWALTASVSGWSYTLCSIAFTPGHADFGQAAIRLAA